MRAIYYVIILGLLWLTQPAFAVDDIYGPGSRSNKGDGAQTAVAAGGGTYADVLPPVGDSPWEEFYYQDLDLSALMARIHELMVNEKYLGQYPQVAAVAKMLDDEGFFKLSGVTTKYAITGDAFHCVSECKYTDLDPAKFPGNLLALPNAQPKSARYLDPDGYLLYVVVNNVADVAKIEMAQMQQDLQSMGEDGQQVLTEVFDELGLGDAQQVLQLLQVMRADQLATDVLSGEVALVLYDTSDAEKIVEGNVAPEDFDGAVFVGIKDSKYVADLLDRYGLEAGLTKSTDVPTGWTAYTLSEDPAVGLMLSEEFVVATPNLPALLKHLNQAKGVEIPACQAYVDINAAALHQRWVHPLAELGMSQFDENVILPTDAAAFLLNLPEPPALGHIVMSSAYDGDRQTSEIHLNKAVVQYGLYYLGVFGFGVAQTEGVNLDFEQ